MTVKIGVLSDSHITSAGQHLPPEMFAAFRREQVGLIFHAGDLVSLGVIDDLSAIAEVRAVAGNTDSHTVKAVLPVKRVETVEDVRIGIIHGNGSPSYLGERMLKLFEGDDIQALVHGHSHEPSAHVMGGILIFNPGCIFGSRSGGPGTFGILKVSGNKIDGKIIRIT